MRSGRPGDGRACPRAGRRYIARKVARYLSWLGHQTRVFNVGSYRRAQLRQPAAQRVLRPRQRAPGEAAPRHGDARARRHARLVRRRAARWHLRRHQQHARPPARMVQERCREQRRPASSSSSRSATTRRSSTPTCARPSSTARLRRAWTPRRPCAISAPASPTTSASTSRSTTPTASYIKIIDVGRKVVLNRIQRLPARRASCRSSSTSTSPRGPIWLTRHGESEFNVLGHHRRRRRPLSPRGEEYAQSLAAFVRSQAPRGPTLDGLDEHAAAHHPDRPRRSRDKPGAWRALDEIDAGVCDGMTYDADQASRCPRSTRRGRPTSSATATRAASRTRTSSSASTRSSSSSSASASPVLVIAPPGGAARALRLPDGQAAERVPARWRSRSTPSSS